jgi:hypothetical protein
MRGGGLATLTGPTGRPRWCANAPLAAFRQLFTRLGYEECVGDEWEVGFEKVAIFVNLVGKPTHAARQLAGGCWTSKLGTAEDVEHGWRDLEGDVFGVVVLLMRRPLPPSIP